MARLNPPTPAFREGTDTHHLDRPGSEQLTTRVPYRLRRRGFIPTWPAPAEVFGVDGVPSDANVPAGTTIAQNTRTKTLYRRVDGQWQSVSGAV